jgi:hypothetical protein
MSMRSSIVNADSAIDLTGFGKHLVELEITLSPGSADKVGVIVGESNDGREQTSIFYHPKDNIILMPQNRAWDTREK